MAKEDTAKLKAEIKSELKDYLATLREEGLPLEEVETKMLSMMEDLMKMNDPRANSTVMDDIPTLEAHPRIVQEVEKAQNARGEESFEGVEDCYAPVLEEVPIFELENQKEVEMESEDEDIEVVWEEEEPKYGKIPNLLCANILENPCALFENTLVDDSLRLNTSVICDYDCFKFREDDSMENFDMFINDYKDSLLFKYEYDCFNFSEDESFTLGESELVSEGDDVSFYSCESVSDFSNQNRVE